MDGQHQGQPQGNGRGKNDKGDKGDRKIGMASDMKGPEYERFLIETVPELQWQMEVDLFRSGDESGAAMRMLGHLEKHLNHKSARDWGEQFKNLLKPKARPRQRPRPKRRSSDAVRIVRGRTPAGFPWPEISIRGALLPPRASPSSRPVPDPPDPFPATHDRRRNPPIVPRFLPRKTAHHRALRLAAAAVARACCSPTPG